MTGWGEKKNEHVRDPLDRAAERFDLASYNPSAVTKLEIMGWMGLVLLDVARSLRELRKLNSLLSEGRPYR